MTEEQILQLIKEYFRESCIRDDGSCSEWFGDTDAFVRFAKRIYEKGRKTGFCEGHDAGWDYRGEFCED